MYNEATVAHCLDFVIVSHGMPLQIYSKIYAIIFLIISDYIYQNILTDRR